MNAVADCGLVSTKEFGKINLSIRYRPIDEMILEENQAGTINDSVYKAGLKKYKNLQYFTFTISSADNNEILDEGNEDTDYYKLLDYLSNSIESDFFLIENGDTLPCVLSHYERNFGLSPKNNVSLAFKSNSLGREFENDKIIAYDDHLFDVGLLHFKFSKENLNKLPILEYEK